ncbi:hypothetical protein VPH35_091996 [Triticum aestivum]
MGWRPAGPSPMAVATALCRALALAPALLLRRQTLVRLLSTQAQSSTAPTISPAELVRIKDSIRSAATPPDELAALFLKGIPHPPFLGDRSIFSLAAARPDLVCSVLSAFLTALPAPHPSEGFLIALYAAGGMPTHSLSTFRLVVAPPTVPPPPSSPPTTTPASPPDPSRPSATSQSSSPSRWASCPTTCSSSAWSPWGTSPAPARCSTECLVRQIE